MTAATAKAPNEVATNLEGALKHDGAKEISGVIDEVRAAQRDPKFMEALNKTLHDGTNDVLGDFQIEGADKNQQQLVAVKTLKNGREVRCELDAAGNRSEIWGNPGHDREFKIDEKGQASHEVKSGDTVWTVACDIIREQKGNPNYKPEPGEVMRMMKRLQAENPAIDPARGGDPDRIKPGQIIKVPQEVTREIKQGREEELVEKDDQGRVSRIQYADGTSFEVTKRDQTSGEITEYKDREGKTWCRKEGSTPPVWENKCNVNEKWQGTIKTGDDGSVEWQEAGKPQKQRMTTDGKVSVEKAEPLPVTKTAAPAAAVKPDPQAAAAAGQKAEAKAGNLRPTNGVYNPIAAPGLCQGKPDESWDSEKGGLDQSGEEDQDNFDIEDRKVRKLNEEESGKEVPADVAVPAGAVVRKYDGHLDAYRGDADPNVHYDDPKFEAVQVTDAQGNVVYNRVDYEKGVNMYFQTGDTPDKYMEFKFVKKVETRYDAATGTYVTTIYANQGKTPYTIRSDKTGKAIKVEDTVSKAA